MLDYADPVIAADAGLHLIHPAERSDGDALRQQFECPHNTRLDAMLRGKFADCADRLA